MYKIGQHDGKKKYLIRRETEKIMKINVTNLLCQYIDGVKMNYGS